MGDRKTYAEMQKRQYTVDPAMTPTNIQEHNSWHDYERLFRRLGDTSKMVALDFGCGPGRNLNLYADRFARIDGFDITENHLESARRVARTHSVLYLGNGYDMSGVPVGVYDLIISTVVLQHICVHEIRLSYMREFFRILKPGGRISMQMAFGPGGNQVAYHDNFYDAARTDGDCDVRVDDPLDIFRDLTSCGFVDFTYELGPVGPGDRTKQWIYFSAMRPKGEQ